VSAPTDRVRVKTGVAVASDFASSQGTPLVIDNTSGTGGVSYLDAANNIVSLRMGRGGFLGHYVDAYGAVGDGATDDTTAIQAAITAAIAGTNGSRTVVFSAKTYRITSDLNLNLTSGKSIRMAGEPGYASLTGSLTNASGTVIECYFTSASKIGIHIFTTGTTTLAPESFCDFQLEDFALKFTGSATDSYGLVIGNTGFQVNGTNNSRISNVNVANFHGDQIAMLSTRYVYFDNVVATSRSSGTTTQALRIVNDDSTLFTGDLTFLACTFVGTGEASQDTVKLVATGTGAELRGVRFIGCVGYYGRYCLHISSDSGGKAQDIFISEACQFDGAAASDSDTKTAVRISATDSGSLTSGISITGSYAVQWQDYGVHLVASSSGVVSNIAVNGNYLGLCEGNGVLLTDCVGVNVIGNTFFDCCTAGAGSGVISVNDPSGLFNIVGNTHYNNSATRTAGYVVAVGEASPGTITEFTVTNNVGHAATAAVFDNTTTGNKTVSGNWMRA